MRSDYENNFEQFLSRLDSQVISILTQRIRDLCALNGILFQSRSNSLIYNHVPLTLFPSPFPLKLLELVSNLQPQINQLLHAVSNDYNFLIEAHKNVCIEDGFIRQMIEIMKKYSQYKYAQCVQVGIIRSDYMLNDMRKSAEDVPKIYLVEYNTISVSFGAHGTDVPKVHKTMWKNIKGIVKPLPDIKLPENPKSVVDDMGNILASAWYEYSKRYLSFDSCILFVVQPDERNVYDQIKVELAILAKIRKNYEKFLKKDFKEPFVYRVTLSEITSSCSINEINGGSLWYKPTKNSDVCYEVAVVYFRCGYTPTDFPNQNCWEGRQMLELNRAIKAPTVAQQLAGSKKVQQLLSDPLILEKFIPSKYISGIMETYCGIYSLDDSNSELNELIEKVRRNPQNYVLKPQREGGGNNYYGLEILKILDKLKESGKTFGEYILMDIIKPPIYKNYLVLPDKESAILRDCVSEIGIWGMYIYDGSSLSQNETSGYLLRTKSLEHLDGGVASGRAVLDSCATF